MRSLIVLAALLGAAAFVQAADDPTIKLAGVSDLSKLQGKACRQAPAFHTCAGRGFGAKINFH